MTARYVSIVEGCHGSTHAGLTLCQQKFAGSIAIICDGAPRDRLGQDILQHRGGPIIFFSATPPSAT